MIVVFGSINVDLVVRVPSLPRPGETVLAPDYRAMAGGKGANQAVAAARAGTATRMVGCVGRDGFAPTALATLREAGVDVSGVAAVDTPTGCAMICVDADGRNQIAVASGANRAARRAQVDDGMLGPGTTVVLQLEVDRDETLAVARRARSRGARVVLNGAPAMALPREAASAIDVLVMNEVEATMLAAGAGLAATDVIAAARGLAESWDVTAVVTLGNQGARAFEPGSFERGAAWRVGVLAVDPVDTTAAGDAFVGVLAAALDAGEDLPAALRRASVAGGLACQTVGAQPSLPEKTMIDAALPNLPAAERM